jgi:hypothetical protein
MGNGLGSRRKLSAAKSSSPRRSQGSFTLELWDANGTRSVILSGVTFP